MTIMYVRYTKNDDRSQRETDNRTVNKFLLWCVHTQGAEVNEFLPIQLSPCSYII